jgi:2-oxoisovalerate dehydrogenase E1 component beta subunit
LTIVSWGAHLRVVQSAVLHAKKEFGVSIEVIDLRTVYPYDFEPIKASVQKTGRVIVTHEAPITSGLGAEISAKITEECFLNLEAPIKRVCGLDTPFPHSNEPAYYPDRLKLFEAIRETLEY